VHWVATREGATTPQLAVARVHAWADHKKRFTDRQIALAFDALSQQGWLSEAPH